MIKFRRDSDEMMCGKRVDGEMSDRYADLGGIACTRTAGHAPPCIATACDAAAADGVCHGCREPVGSAHRADCVARTVDKKGT